MENATSKLNIIEEAKQDIRSGYSIRQAAKKHNIAYTVLQRHLKNNDVKKQRGQTVLAEAEERSIAEKLVTCSEWGYPLDTFDLRLVIQQYLNRAGRVVSRFKDNLPGKEFAYSFFKRHSRILSERMCQNIK
ncbi:CENP-B N-terminal DNA-binding domain [Popillia japonica]|uniref:CENP-B N-terminal DNA-binding domain n=1 Tax=Popillia japonica TaxID=7064 RepID=A0AAW1L547_POPJA